ncbi:proline dehydrogenase [Vibrio astriarenae]|nr:proline dehydrogenase [Vibrio sp. C7]
MLTGKVIGLDEGEKQSPSGAMNRLVNKMSEPVIRRAMHQAMKIMGASICSRANHQRGTKKQR